MAEREEKRNMNKIFALLEILDKDKRYLPEAYSFTMSSLEFTTKKLGRRGHVSGTELLEGIKEYALEKFGPMARTVLEYWGVKSTNDFGEIIFNMIEIGMLGRTEQDSKKDFDNRFDFKTAFDHGCKYTSY